MRTEAEITAEAIEAGLTNPDGSAITTEEQLAAAKELAAAEAEQPADPPEEDILLKTALSILMPEEPAAAPDATPAPDVEADKDKNLATLKEWGVEMPADATAEAIAAKVAEGKPATPPAAPAAPEAPATKKKKKFSVVPADQAEIIERPAAPTAPVVAAPVTPAPATDPDEEYIKTLSDDQREELHEAAVAEMLEPVKYKGQRKKLLDFFRRFENTAREVQAREPEADLEQNETIKTLASQKPNLAVADQKRVLRKMGADEGRKSTLDEINPQLSEMRQTQRRIELEPKFQNFAQNIFKKGIHTLIVNDPQSPVSEAVKVINEKGIDEARKDYALEVRIYEDEVPKAVRRVEQFLLLKNEAVSFNRQNPDPDHVYVMNFVEREGQFLADYEAKNGRVVDKARTFLPRSEFIKMLSTNAAEAATFNPTAWKTKTYCTFTDTAIVDMLAKNAQNTIEHRVKTSIEEGQKMGFERRAKSKLPSTTNQPAKEPKEIVPPRATPSAIKPAKPQVPPPVGDGVDVMGTMYAHHTKR